MPALRTPLGQAADAAQQAASHLSMARTLDGVSAWRQSACIEAARSRLREALRLIDDEPTPAPAAALTPDQIRRADLVATCFDIAAPVAGAAA